MFVDEYKGQEYFEDGRDGDVLVGYQIVIVFVELVDEEVVVGVIYRSDYHVDLRVLIGLKGVVEKEIGGDEEFVK